MKSFPTRSSVNGLHLQFRLRHLWLLLTTVSPLNPPLAAQETSTSYNIGAVLVDEGPTLDGSLEDVVWQRGTLIDVFIQQEPDEGSPSTERTEVRILHDGETLYLGVFAFDSEPEALTATEMRRDSERILQEDNFQIILDTFRDSRSGYMFVTNPLGAMLDQQVANEGEGGRFGRASSNVNRDWDGVWEVVAKKVPEGWIAEIAIPMITLRFPESEPQSWGINLMRNIGRKNEQAFWSPIPKPYSITRVSLAGTLDNLSSLNRGRDLRITPFVTGGASRIRSAGVTDDALQRDIGMDLKYGVSASLNLDVTINTDFAQAEVDDEQVNLTRFALFYPEKRDFFLENAGQFNVGSVSSFNRLADLFFTRRIGLSDTGETVPIIGGVRLTGKLGRNDIALMDVQTNGVFEESGENFLVARYSRNILTRSKVGALFINKAQTNGTHYNRTYAVDMTLAPHANFTVTGFLAKTETPSISTGDMAGYLNATWLSQSWRIYGEFGDLQDNFNPEVGFLPRRGIRTTKLHVEWNPRPDRWGIRMLSPMYDIMYTTDQQNRLVSRRYHFMNGTVFDNGAYLNIFYNRNYERLDEPFIVRKGVTIVPGAYRYGQLRLSFNSNQARRVYYNLMLAPQTFFDGTRVDMNATLGARVTNQFSAQASYTRNDIDLSAGEFKVHLAAFRVDYALSPTLTLRTLTQYNSLSDQWGTSARLRYTYRPGSDIYVVYDEVRRDPTDPTGLLEFRDRRLMLKASYLLSR
jgi:hypothetical protein